MLLKEIPESKILNVRIQDTKGNRGQIISFINPIAKTWAVRKEDAVIVYRTYEQMKEWSVEE